MCKDATNSATNQIKTLFSFDDVFRDKKSKVDFNDPVSPLMEVCSWPDFRRRTSHGKSHA